MKQLGQHAPPRHSIAHLSDPHLIGGGRLHYGVIDNVAHLRAALARLAEVRPAPQALVFTGDLADQAEPEAYATLRSIVEPAAAQMGAIVVWTMGNHDERAPYARGLYDSDDDGCQDRVHEVDGLRIVALDTSVPGYHHGELRPEQLAWLADVLATPAEHGTLLAMHHPPLPVPMLRAAELIELHDQHALADVIAAAPQKTLQYHVKDREPGLDPFSGNAFADVGTGFVDFPLIFGDHMTKEFIVENDQPDVDPITTARVGYGYLRTVRAQR